MQAQSLLGQLILEAADQHEGQGAICSLTEMALGGMVSSIYPGEGLQWTYRGLGQGSDKSSTNHRQAKS